MRNHKKHGHNSRSARAARHIIFISERLFPRRRSKALRHTRTLRRGDDEMRAHVDAGFTSGLVVW